MFGLRFAGLGGFVAAGAFALFAFAIGMFLRKEASIVRLRRRSRNLDRCVAGKSPRPGGA
jgi:hypothetical protein